MKRTKKSIYTIVYWLISCPVIIVSDIIDVLRNRNSADDIFVPGSSIDLFFMGVTFGIQLFFHVMLFACTRYWFFSKNKTFLGVLFMILLSAVSVGVLLLYYYHFIIYL